MDDDIERLLLGASRAQLRALLALAEGPSESVEDVLPRLADPEALIDALKILLPQHERVSFWVERLTASDTPASELQALQTRAAAWFSQAEREGLLEAQAATLLVREGAGAALRLRFAADSDGGDTPDQQMRYARLSQYLDTGPLAELFRQAARA